MKYKTLFIFFILVAVIINLNAQHKDAGTTGFAFMKMNFSARAMGMSNAFTGLSNDGDAVFFNTAGLAQTNKHQLKSTYMNHFDSLQGGAIVYNTDYNDDWKIAPFIKFLVSDDITRTDTEGLNIGTFNTFSSITGIGFARTINDALDIGFNLMYFYEKLDEFTASAVVFDFSVLHQTNNPNLKLGATLKNVGSQMTYYTESEYNERLPLTFVVGAGYNISDKTFLTFDLIKHVDHDFYGKFGAEFLYNSYFAIRAGFDTRMNDYKVGQSNEFMSGLSMGVGFNWQNHSIDFATASMGGLGLVNQISVSYLF